MSSEKRKVLFVSSSPNSEQRLDLDKELRNTINSLYRTVSEEQYDLFPCVAARIGDLREDLRRRKPNIVHFCGHGCDRGLVFINDVTEKSEILSTDQLSELFELCAEHTHGKIECVLLNACYSETQAKAISHYVDNVIGMSFAISDESAIKFSKAFYESIAAKKDYRSSYRLARAELNEIDQKIPIYIDSTLANTPESKKSSELIRHYFEQQRRTNQHLKTVIDIKDNFIPLHVSTTNNETLSEMLYKICQSTPSNPNYLLGEAGTGKTYGLLNAWCELVSKGINAIYIPLNMIDFASSKEALLKYLKKYVFRSFTSWQDIWSIENSKAIKPLLLILDGFNEVSAFDKQQLLAIGEIDEIAKTLNVVICVSSRKVDNLKYVSTINSKSVNVLPITKKQIEEYVNRVCRAEKINLTPKLFDLLKTPLMLALYCESSEYYNGSVHPAFPCVEYILGEPSESTIIWNYLQCMVSKAFELNEVKDPNIRFSYIILIRYITPFIANQMQINDIFKLSLQNIRQDESSKRTLPFDKTFEEAVNYFKRLYADNIEEITTLRRECDVEQNWEVDIEKLRKIALNDLGLFVKNKDSVVLFHQSIRDCMSAMFYINEIKFCKYENGRFPASWANNTFKREFALIKHIAELDEGLGRSTFQSIIDILWEKLRMASPEYREKQISIHKAISESNLSTPNTSQFSQNLVSNCIYVYKNIYKSDFSGLNFTGIDLSATSMDEFIFSNQDQGRHAVLGNAIIGNSTFAINGHSEDEIIFSVAYGNKVLLSRSDKCLRIWDTDTQKCTDVLLDTEIGKDIPFLDVNFNGSSTFIYSDGKSIIEYNVNTKLFSLFTTCDEDLLSVCYSPNGKMVMCSDKKNNIILFDAITKKVIYPFVQIESDAESKVDNDISFPFLHCNCSNKYICYICTTDDKIHLVDIESKIDTVLLDLDKNSEIIRIVFSNTDALGICAILFDSHFYLVDLNISTIICTKEFNSVLTDVVFSSSDEYLAVCSEDQNLFVYKVKDLIGNANIKDVHSEDLIGNNAPWLGSFYSLSFGDNDKKMYIGDNYGKIHCVTISKEMGYSCFDGKPPSVLDLDIDGSENYVVGAYSNGSVKKWDIINGVLDSEYLTDKVCGSANCISYSKNNDIIAVGFSQGKICFWNSTDNSLLSESELDCKQPVLDVAFTNDDTHIICACRDGSLHVWDLKSKKEILKNAHSKKINSLLLYECEQFRHLISVSDDGTAKMWRFDPSLGDSIEFIKDIYTSTKKIKGLALFDNKKDVVKFAVLSDDGHLHEFNMADGLQINDIQLQITESTSIWGFEDYCGNNASVAIDYCSDGNTIAIAFSSRRLGCSGIQLINSKTGEFFPPIPYYKFEYYHDFILNIKFIKDNSIVFSSCKGDIVVVDSTNYAPLFDPLYLDYGYMGKLANCDRSEIIDTKGISKHFVGGDMEKIILGRNVIFSFERILVDTAPQEIQGVMLNPFKFVNSATDIENWTRDIVNLYKSRSKTEIPEKNIIIFLTSLAQYLYFEAPKDEQNIYMMCELVQAAKAKMDQSNYESDLDRLFLKILKDKKPRHIALRNYKKFKKQTPLNIMNRVYQICHRIFSPIIYSENDILCHAKDEDDLMRLAISFISNSDYWINSEEYSVTTIECDNIENALIEEIFEINLLYSVFLYMLTEIKIRERNLSKAKNILINSEKLFEELQDKYPSHSAVELYFDIKKILPENLSFSVITNRLVSRFDSLMEFRRGCG